MNDSTALSMLPIDLHIVREGGGCGGVGGVRACVCVCVYACVCMCMCVYVYVYVCVYECKYIKRNCVIHIIKSIII